MRVAFTTPATFDQVRGGGERYVRNMARGLVRASAGAVNVRIVAPARERMDREVEPGVSLRGLTVRPDDASYGEGLAWDLVDAVLESDVTHVHQVFTRFGEASVLAARTFARPVCITDHGGTTSAVGRRLGLIELAGAAVAYSRFGAASLGDSPKVTIIEGGVDASFFNPADVEPQRRSIMFAGRLMAHKGVDALIRACPDGVPLQVAGTMVDRDYFDHLQRIAAGKDVAFLLDVTDEELRDMYRQAIAVVLPSVHIDMHGRVHRAPELMGLSTLEGMSCGAPAVVTHTGGLPEYVEDGVTGFVVASEPELTSRLAQLASDAALVRRMGEAARARVVRDWDIEVAGRALLTLYERLGAR